MLHKRLFISFFSLAKKRCNIFWEMQQMASESFLKHDENPTNSFWPQFSFTSLRKFCPSLLTRLGLRVRLPRLWKPVAREFSNLQILRSDTRPCFVFQILSTSQENIEKDITNVNKDDSIYWWFFLFFFEIFVITIFWKKMFTSLERISSVQVSNF